MTPLSPIQSKVLTYMKYCVAKDDNMPNSRQIAQYFGWSSQTAAMNHLRMLERKGYIERIKRGKGSYRFSRKKEDKP